MKNLATKLMLLLLLVSQVARSQTQPDPRILLDQAGATTGQVLKWDGTKWVPDTDLTGTADAYGVLDSTAFRAFNVATAPKYIILTDSLRGGKFRRNYTATADQYMVFTDALGRKWERFDTDGRYNAKWFGAKGNGSTDDRWYLQYLADYINAKGGGTLYMPKGIYNVSKKTSTGTGLSLWNNTTLEGDGWQTVFNYTETFVSASSAAIGSRSGNADRSQVQQDSGNVNISIRNLKINFTTKVNRRGNGIGLGGTVGGKIHNVWVNGSGGYSIHIVKNNDTALAEGKRSENIGISNCLITDFGDTGIEFSGTNNCTASDCEISGPGLVSDIGSAVIVWNGSTNTTISNITIKATANAVSSGIAGVWVQPSYNPLSTPNYKQTSKTVLSNIVAENCHYGLIIGTDEAGPIWGKSKNTIVSNCIFTGNPLYGIGVQVNNADTILMSDTKFSDFSRNIDVSSTQTFSNQRNVNNLSIKDCVFWGGLTPGFNAITGVNDLEFSGNTIENTPSTGITFRGIRGATVNDNIFKNIGTSGNVSATVFNNGNGTDTRASKHITANNNRLVDDRATKTTFFCIQLAGATDSCLVMGNDARGGKSGAIAYTNAGTGTSIKFKDTYTGEPYNSDLNSDAIANAVLTTDGSGVGLWLLRTSLFTASNGVRAVGSDFQLGSSSTAVGPGDYTGNIFHNLRGFNSTWNTSVGTSLFINGATADIGIRTSTPLASFHIGGGGNFRLNDGFKFSTDGGNNAELSSPSSLYLYAGIPIGSAPSGTAELNVTDNLVGIRTSSPSQHLHVNGNLRVTGQFYDSSNAPGGAGQVLTSGGSTTAWATLSPSEAAGVLDSTAFRAFNVATAPKYIIMTDSLRGGKFRRCYTCTADQYMVFTDALGRKWERFNYTFVTPEMFGSRGGLSQDSLPITRALNWPKKDVVFTRPYYSSATLTLTESKTIYGNHSVLKLKTVLSTSTPNFIIKASDVRVVDLTIKGLINTQTGEWSAGIQIGGPSDPVNNIVLENLNIRDTRGDGVYIASTSLKRGNIDIINVHTNNCMRNGMTITAGDNININGFTADSCSLLGIDLEPDVVTQVTRNLHINNIHVPSIGFGTHEDTIHSNITVQNFVIDNSKRGSSVSYVDASPTHKYGIILRGVQNAKFLNGNIINCKLEGIFFSANADRPCKDISFENIHMVNNHNTGTSFWVATEEAFERINFKNCNFIGSATFPFFTNVDAKWNNCKFTGFGAVVVNFGGVFENCEATVVDRFAYVPATPVVIRNSTIATGSLITPDSPTPILSGELINNTLTLSGAIIGGSLKHNIVTRDNLINGRYFDLVSSGMTINQTWLVKKTSGAMSITLPKWLGANKDFILVDSVRNGVTTITGDFVGAGSFATDGYSSYRFTFSGNVWHPEIASLNTPLSTILQEGATTGQAVTWNGSAWVAGNPVASLTLTNKQIGFGNVSNTLVGSSKFQYDDTDAAILLGDGTNVGYKIQMKRTAGGITTGEEISLYSNNSPTLQRVLGGFSNGELSGTSYAEANPAIDVFIPAARYRMFGRINVAASTAYNVSNVFPILTMMTNTGYAGIGLAYGVDPSTHFHINGNLRVTGTIKDANNEDGTSGQVLSSTATGTDWVADKNGYYGGNGGNGGDGTVPNGTTSTLANDFTLAGTDNVGGVPAFRVTTGGSAADKGLQTWRPSTGTDSLLLHTDAGAYKLDAKGKSLDISSPVGTSISTTSASITLAHTTGTIGVNAADRTDFTGTDLTFSTSSVGSTTAIMQPLVITAANVTVSSSQSEIICLGQSGDINLTFNYTPFSIIGGTHRIKITNSSPFKVILIRGGSWDWRDSYGVASVTNKTVYSGQTVDLIWGDGAGTDYWLIKTNESYTTGIQEETATTVTFDGRSNMLYIPTSATTTTINLPEIVASGPTVSQVTVGAKFKIAIDREANVTIARGGASDLIKAHNYSTTGQTSVVTTGGTFFTQTFTAVGANLWIVN